MARTAIPRNFRLSSSNPSDPWHRDRSATLIARSATTSSRTEAGVGTE